MTKKVPPTRFPDAAAVAYSRAMKKMIDTLNKELEKLFKKYIVPELNSRNDSILFVNDDLFDGSKEMFRIIKEKDMRIFSTMTIKRIATLFLNSVNRFNRHNIEQQMRVKGIRMSDMEPWLNEFMQEKIAENVSYISNLSDDYLKNVENIVSEGIQRGHTAKQMREQIANQVKISKNRAQFIAVDQAGSIFGQMTARRHQSLGISRFKWRTSKDERVRDTHQQMEGKTYYYSDPPRVGKRNVLPGEDYRCRCVAIPVFDDDNN